MQQGIQARQFILQGCLGNIDDILSKSKTLFFERLDSPDQVCLLSGEMGSVFNVHSVSNKNEFATLFCNFPGML
jgi:hypothetical protein